MKKLSLLTLCLFTFFVSQAQSDPTKPEEKQKSFIASIRTLDSKTIKGRLSVVSDSQLVLTKAVTYYNKKSRPLIAFVQYQVNDQQNIPAETIRSFSLRRENRVLKGAGIGLGLGVVCGVLAGSGDPEAAAGGGVTLGFIGAIVGTLIGTHAERFIINGNQEKFRNLRSEISMKIEKK